jgi:hypothetical protein
MRGRARRCVRALGVALALMVGAAPGARAAGAPFQARAQASPSTVKVGERVAYRAILTGGGPARVRVFAPVTAGDLTWGGARGRHRRADGTLAPVGAQGWYDVVGPRDSIVVDVPLQVFRPGRVDVPGLRVQIDGGGGPHDSRFPTLTLLVAPVIAADDSTADLRPVRGPLPAPWWERVPWRWVAVAALALAVMIALVVLWRRRRRVTVPATATRPARRRDPLADGLAALAALRARGLPAEGRFGEHAFELTRILRTFLEGVVGATRPGDTSPELVGHLEEGRLARPDLERLAGLLSRWDRVKFARAATTAAEAAQAEEAVESMMRRLGTPVVSAPTGGAASGGAPGGGAPSGGGPGAGRAA